MSTRPNVLWLSYEDTSPRFGCYGDRVARSPHTDALAAQGCRWPNAFCTAPVCAPSRFSIITGVYATTAGAHHMRTTHQSTVTPEMPTPYGVVPPAYVKCLGEYFRRQGYFCTNNEKTDYQFEVPLSAWNQQGKQAHWRNRPDPEQPFFAVFNLNSTHESGMWEKDGADEPDTDPASVTLPPYLPDTPRGRRALARQYDNIAHEDAKLGDLLAQLEEDGLAENTIVVVWSDHGEGLPRGKRWCYDSGLRIPLIVRWPGRIEAGTVSEELVSLIDLGPTMLSCCGIDVPAHMQGQPFMGPERRSRDYCFASRDRFDTSYDMVRSVRDRRWRYVRNYHPELPYLLWIPYRNRHPIMQELWRLHAEGGLDETQLQLMREQRPVEELYDCQADPHQINNLADDSAHRGELERLRGVLDSWRADTGDLGDVPESELVLRMWPGGEQPQTAPVVLVPLGPELSGQEVAAGRLRAPAPLLLQMHCATQGASLLYRFDDGDDDDGWQLYGGPLRLEPGRSTLRGKAVRIGYRDGEERALQLDIA